MIYLYVSLNTIQAYLSFTVNGFDMAHNIGLNKFIISYDINARSGVSANEFHEKFARFLLDGGCIDVVSYTNSCILFTSYKTFAHWDEVIGFNFHEQIWCVLSEITRFSGDENLKWKKGAFLSVHNKNEDYSNEFDYLIKRIKRGD